MASISIIGMPAAGKTVFLSVLAMRFRTPSQGRPWLEYTNRKTQKYISDTWDILSNSQNPDWPPSTPAGSFLELEWNLHTANRKIHSVRVRDPAGQDIIAAFDSLAETRTGIQRDLRLILDGANLVLFLVNLRPIIDAPDQRTIDQFEIPLKLALESVLSREQASVAILVTQYDGISAFLEAAEPGNRDPAQAIARYLPQLRAIFRRHSGRISAFFVASVAETQAFIEPDGKTYRRPRPGFASKGLDDVLYWIDARLGALEQTPEVPSRILHFSPLRATSAATEEKRGATRVTADTDGSHTRAEVGPPKYPDPFFASPFLSLTLAVVYSFLVDIGSVGNDALGSRIFVSILICGIAVVLAIERRGKLRSITIGAAPHSTGTLPTYTVLQIAFLALLSGPIGVSWAISRNFWSLGRHRLAEWSWVVGAAATPALGLLVSLLEKGFRAKGILFGKWAYFATYAVWSVFLAIVLFQAFQKQCPSIHSKRGAGIRPWRSTVGLLGKAIGAVLSTVVVFGLLLISLAKFLP